MKLQSKINRHHLLIAILELIITIVILYEGVSSFVIHQRRERLQYIKEKILAQAEKGELNSLPGVIEVKEIENPPSGWVEQFRDTSIYEPSEGEAVPYLLLEFLTTKDGKNYLVTVFQPLLEKIPLVGRISIGLTLIFIFLALVLYGLPKRVIKKIWNPFYATVDKLKKYRVAQEEPFSFTSTDIDEFKELNDVIKTLTIRIREDYLNLKEFTENASHEIQTPLAVIKSKIELLLQDESLNEDQLKLLQSIDDVTTRLSKLNQSLLLLTKIENRQFGEKRQINLTELIDKHLSELREMIEMQHITIESQIQQRIVLVINPALADILIRNLLKNAIRYCSEPCIIKISLIESTEKGFIGELNIANTGVTLNISPDKIFERFVKDKSTSESLGLGLAIVKKICEVSGLQIQYSYLNNFHIFKIIL